MDARAALLDLVLSVEPLVRRQGTAVQRRARAAWRRALTVLAPERAREAPASPDGPPDAEALVRAYLACGGTHEALVGAIARLRGISIDDLTDW
ncbi:hypothetical protein [Roseospira goensis]|uniref:Uncharacterized protein n=1 Tax=Roseospira goensis TaxID=391922 RepID=A0A7W6S2K2_9PROT|nr:hypothetical protein [Roseospira goensis]MBB4287723.1 hypothetical protein [Roseospira goensis]